MSHVEAVKRAAESGCFGDRVPEQILIDDEKQKGFQLASNLFFVKLVTGSTTESVVVKTQPDHRRDSESTFRDSHFQNEVCFYSDILPFLARIDDSVSTLFPRFVFGCATSGKDAAKDCVIIENVSSYGFRSIENAQDPDVEHIILALKSLAKFHALSYKAKKEKPTVFRNLLSNLINDMATMEGFIAAAFQSAPNCYKGHQVNAKRLEEYCRNEPLARYQHSISPKEPNAVLCHGDFCANNLLFSYHNEQPQHVMFVDMQRCKYASPAIDLSFFLFYNTSAKTKIHWDLFLRTYYESLKNAYEDVVVPSFCEFMQDFTDHVTYGLFTCSYFFRVSSLAADELDGFLLLEKNEKTKAIQTVGGDKGTGLINEMLQLAISKNYI